jgi:hypothetical protein
LFATSAGYQIGTKKETPNFLGWGIIY